MCLSIPSRVVEITQDQTMCRVDTMGVLRDANLMMMEDGDVAIGDFVLLHIGFVMNKIDEDEALESIETYREILSVLDEEEMRQVIIDEHEAHEIIATQSS